MQNKENKLVLKGTAGEELLVFQPITLEKEKKENLIPVSENMASFLTNAGVTTGITTISGSRLFHATVNPATLMTYADNTISSIVMEGGKISTHAGFQTVSSAAVFAPMLAFQLTSMITGQYYFNLLSKQMEHLSESVNKILSFLEDKDKAVISETRKRLDEFSIQMRYRTTDDDILFRIHQYIDKISEIVSLYRILWEREFNLYEKDEKKEKNWQSFSNAKFQDYWNIFSSSLYVLAYARVLEFVIRLEKNTKLYPALQKEYAERFREYRTFQVMGLNFYLPDSCREPLERTASCIDRILKDCTQGKHEKWISERDRKKIKLDEENSLNALRSFCSENIELSRFNIQFKENMGKVFEKISCDNDLYFDASSGQYYLQGN